MSTPDITPYAFGLLAVILTGVGIFLKSWFEQKAKLQALQVRVQEINIDDTARRSELSAEAQALIQKTYGEQASRIQRLEEQVDHQRDLIDNANSENAKLQTDGTIKDTTITSLKDQQTKNVETIGRLSEQILQLQASAAERDKLRDQVAALEQRVAEMQTVADSRHQEMSRITGENFELNVKLKKTNEALENAQRLLRECYEAAKSSPGKEELS